MHNSFIASLQHNTFVHKYSGNVTKQTIMDSLSEQFKNRDFNNIIKIISDFRQTKISFNEDDLNEITQFIKINSTNDNQIYNVIITDDPMITAYTIIFQDLMRDKKNYKCFVCSTTQKACEYLNLSEDSINLLVELIKSKTTSI